MLKPKNKRKDNNTTSSIIIPVSDYRHRDKNYTTTMGELFPPMVEDQPPVAVDPPPDNVMAELILDLIDSVSKLSDKVIEQDARINYLEERRKVIVRQPRTMTDKRGGLKWSPFFCFKSSFIKVFLFPIAYISDDILKITVDSFITSDQFIQVFSLQVFLPIPYYGFFVASILRHSRGI